MATKLPISPLDGSIPLSSQTKNHKKLFKCPILRVSAAKYSDFYHKYFKKFKFYKIINFLNNVKIYIQKKKRRIMIFIKISIKIKNQS